MADRSLIEQLDQAIDAMLSGAEQGAAGMKPLDSTLSTLMGIAADLRDLPADFFKTRLAEELEAERYRRISMTHPPSIEPTAARPAAIHTITPFICVPEGARLIEFMKHTFDAEETDRHPHGPDGFVAAVRIGDADLLVMGGESFRGSELPGALHVYVKDCDATYRRALEAGASTIDPSGIGEPADRPYGERAAFVSDPFGNVWFIATRLQADYVGEGLLHVTPCLLPVNASPVIDFMERAFGARVEGVHKEGDRIGHAFIRIGDAMVELAETEQASRPYGFYLHTDDVDALYTRAMAAGGVSILAPADQSYGERLAIIEDPGGNRWFAAKRIVMG